MRNVVGSVILVVLAGCGGDDGSSPTEIDYSVCGGSYTYFPDGHCAGGACADSAIEQRAYASWRRQVLAVSGMSDAELAERIEIDYVSDDNPGWVEIRYVVVLDAIRLREDTDIMIEGDPTDAELDQAVAIGIEDAEWTGLAAIDEVASPGTIEDAVVACATAMTVDWCSAAFENQTGTLYVQGFWQEAPDQCHFARVNVATGAMSDCYAGPCGAE